jgi:excisionase family DNA binding protein
MTGKRKAIAKFKRKTQRPDSSHSVVDDGLAVSLSIGQAGALLGVSPPTVRRMVAEGELEYFRTPGGHVRIVTQSLRRLGDRSANPDPFSVHAKQEELERLRLDAQMLKEKREIEKLKADQEAEDSASREEDDLRRQEILAERERLKVQLESVRVQKAKDKAVQKAEKELAAFRSRWLAWGISLLAGIASLEEERKVNEALVKEISCHQPFEEPAMPHIVTNTVYETLGEKATFGLMLAKSVLRK